MAGTANHELADAITSVLGLKPGPSIVERFPDGELRPRVRDAQGADVYVVQPTGPDVDDHIVELMLLLDVCHSAGAARVIAVVPHVGCARQDRRLRAVFSLACSRGASHHFRMTACACSRNARSLLRRSDGFRSIRVVRASPASPLPTG